MINSNLDETQNISGVKNVASASRREDNNLEDEYEGRSKSRRRKTIKRVVKKRMEDGTLVPIEITKTIIAADGSRSVIREVPEYVKNAKAVGNRALSALGNRGKDHITESCKEFQHSKAYLADNGKIILNRTETTNVY